MFDRMSTRGWRALCLAPVLLLGACSSIASHPSVHVDAPLQGYLTVEAVHQSVNSAGLLEVHVAARNLTDQPLHLQYQFDWLDVEGRNVPSLLARKNRLTIDRQRQVTIEGVAPTESVEAFRLYIEERPK
ncbi:MAG: YcfL family protein [Gammaproteobacteria bacterium]|nr:YcfL family protein [Gammaproteobacteria bacterium]